ncbi:DNA polymerase II large subunit [Candidatus Pacearchaeota archaeon]|nr:DNA polymerase II large subunit [Candidatus Pacearchaeota archaeon]
MDEEAAACGVEVEDYFKRLVRDVKKEYVVAEAARAKKLDPVDKVEIPLAMSLAEKSVGLISTIYPQLGEKVTKRLLELEDEYGQLDPAVSFKIAEEVAKERFCKFENLLQAIDAGIRVGFAYATLGVVASPIEGYTELKLGKTKEGKEYFIAYFSGPIRSAGTTASCLVLMIIDYLREIFGFAKYDPDESEIKRYVTENVDYHERVTNLQYFPTEEEMEFLARNLPIQIAGDPTEKREVSNYKDLPRVETNFIRGGMCLIFSEGLAQKAQKGYRLYNSCKERGFKMSGFDWIPDYLEVHKKRESGSKESGTEATYIKDLVAGRPVYGHPSKSGGFRFRYGRSRVAGFSSVSIHPATMGISNDFLSSGTQLKIEKPTKGCIITSCDDIDGPIVKLKNGSVKRVEKLEDARKLYNEVEEIIYLGDILFPLGDVINRNSELLKPGYVEEWWELELRKKLEVTGEKFEDICKGKFDVSVVEAVGISEKYSIPLHPKFIFYWTQISVEDFFWLMDWMQNGVWRGGAGDGELVLPYSKSVQEKFKEAKRSLELLGVEHEVVLDNVVIFSDAKALLVNLGIENLESGVSLKKETEKIILNHKGKKNVLEIVNECARFKIKDKAGTWIGARMGRPEKAKLRKLTGSPSVLFPIGDEGGRFRSVQEAVKVGSIKSDFPIYKCECGNETIYKICEKCGKDAKRMYWCAECREITEAKCKEHERARTYYRRKIDSKYFFENAIKQIGIEKFAVPELIKGIRGTSSEEHDFENLAKGILRSKYHLCVNKDGTVRYDGTEIMISHFKPKEIGTSVKRLREFGYVKDVYGAELKRDDQILELMPHDILLPACPVTQDEKADDVFFNITKFVDEELEKFYGLPRFYDLEKKEDLVGHLVACMAPHNCAGVIGRIIGFCKLQGLVASPYMHAAMRRDCFDYGTYIPIKQKGSWRMVKIGELVEKLGPKKIVDDYGTKEIKIKGFDTIGFDKKLKKVGINNFTKHAKRPMFEIKTSLGKKIVVSENHKFLVGGEVKKASGLKIGDKLPLMRKIHVEEKDLTEVNLLEFLGEENLMVRGIRNIISKMKDGKMNKILGKLGISKRQFQNFKIRDSYPVEFVLSLKKGLKEEIFRRGRLAVKRDNVEVPIVVKLSRELLEVGGLYVAEGYSRSVGGKKGLNQVYVASDDSEIRDFVRKVIWEHFGLKPSENKKDRVTFSSKILYLFFTKILEAGSAAKDKRVPYLFLNLPLIKLSCFLRGYFEGDGSLEKKRKKICCDSISEGLLSDLEFCLARFGIFVKRYEYEKEPGPRVREFYIKKQRVVPKFKITKLVIGSDFVEKFIDIGFLSNRKKKVLKSYDKKGHYGMRIDYDDNFVYDPIVSIDLLEERESYCLNVDSENHLVVANGIVSEQCDGDEAAVMLLLDVLLNFSRKFLPAHRGGTQDAPLVLNAHIRAGEVDDQILDFEVCFNYPLEMYESAEEGKHSSEVEIETVKSRLKSGKCPFTSVGFTHDSSDFNESVVNSSYKTLPTMKDKVENQMELVQKIRAVDTDDVARLIIERHFIRDIRGNLRKFSHQQFRCVACNEKFRRPPLSGICTKCNGKIIFTISEGSIKKYLEPAINLAETFAVSEYTRQCLNLAKLYIESIFGKDLDRQVDLKGWF